VDLRAVVAAFNAAVASGDWDAYVAQFADDGVLEFVGPPVGPFVGRDQISAAYAATPPDDLIELDGPVRQEGPETVAAYRWRSSGATGAMRLTVLDDEILRLTVLFD
jgi:ketosteroid isomerase-like protein